MLEDDYFLKQIIGKTEFEEKLTTLLDGTFDECNEVGVSISKMVDDVINELFSYNPSPVALRGHIQTLINNIRTILDEGPFTDEDEDDSIAMMKMLQLKILNGCGTNLTASFIMMGSPCKMQFKD